MLPGKIKEILSQISKELPKVRRSLKDFGKASMVANLAKNDSTIAREEE